jgi:hypothetical protein
MAYSPLVPNANNTVGTDLTAMQENFSLLESAQVVDEGSTADGDYWRFEDGLQICLSTIFNLIAGYTKNPPIYFTLSDNRKTWNYPVSFSSTPTVIGAPTDSFYASISINGVNTTLSNIGIIAEREVLSGSEVTIKAIAIGRWK